MTEMLLAIRSGVVEDRWAPDGIEEITAGQTRVAPSLLEERPQYRDFFEDDFSAPGTDAERSHIRVYPGNRPVLRGR
jgi:hypothetical protein